MTPIMSPKQQLLAEDIATMLGWEEFKIGTGLSWKGKLMGRRKTKQHFELIPPWPADLNLMRELELILLHSQQLQYGQLLLEIVGHEYIGQQDPENGLVEDDPQAIFSLASASAEQRAMAFIKVDKAEKQLQSFLKKWRKTNDDDPPWGYIGP